MADPRPPDYVSDETIDAPTSAHNTGVRAVTTPVSGSSPSASEDAVHQGPYGLLRNRNFVVYLAGRFIASFTQQMLTVAVGWELYERTHSALALGLVGVAQIVPMFLFTLPAGHLADNHDRKRIILAMTALMSLASLSLCGVSYFQLPVAVTYVCLFLSGTARTFLWPASAAFLPQVVPKGQLPQAIAWNTGSFHLSSVAGPSLAGAFLALTHRASPVFLLHSLGLVACFILMMRVRYQPSPPVKEPMSVARLVSGFRFVLEQRIILGTITLDLFAVLLGGATALLPVYAKDILGQDAGGLGLLQAALPAGSLLCSLTMAHRPPLERSGRALLWAVAGFGIATIVFGISRNFWLSWAMLFLCGVTDNISVIVRHTLVQVLTPDEKRGRVSAVNSLFIGTSNELGGFESGFVAHLAGPVFAVVSGGIGTLLVVAVVAWRWPEIRRFGRLDGSR